MTILTACLAYKLGLAKEIPVLAVAVSIHEGMHMLAAWMCGLEIEHIDLMPFGGAAHIKDIYCTERWQLIVTAVAGPAANLLAVMAAAALSWWDVLAFSTAAAAVRVNMLLMLFNLMPALPLDGGRILYAILRKWLTHRAALRIGVIMAYVLAGLLIVLFAAGIISYGVINITYPLLGVFIVASAIKERETAAFTAAKNTVQAVCGEAKLPCAAESIAVPEELPTSSAMRFIHPGKTAIFAIIRDGRIRRFSTAYEMAHTAISISEN